MKPFDEGKRNAAMGSRRAWTGLLRRAAVALPFGMAAMGPGCASPEQSVKPVASETTAVVVAGSAADDNTRFAAERVTPAVAQTKTEPSSEGRGRPDVPLSPSEPGERGQDALSRSATGQSILSADGRPAALLGSPTSTLRTIEFVDVAADSAQSKSDSAPPGSTGSGQSKSTGPTATIDLGIALRLAGVDNPTIDLAWERVQEALANQLAARSLLLPSVNVGGNYRSHSGVLQAETGQMRDVDLQSLYTGLGAQAVGSGPVSTPGVRLFAHLGDAFYEPLAARQLVSERKSEAEAVQNSVLLDVVTAYLLMAGAEGRLSLLEQAQKELDTVVRLTNLYAAEGQGRRSDANRVAARAATLTGGLADFREEIATASARLTRLLNLDPSVGLRTPNGPIELIHLFPEDSQLEPLIEAAMRSRPELLARSAALFHSQVRERQEQLRPWVPTVSAGYSYAAFGGGSNQTTPEFSPLRPRSDFDLVAVWNFQNLGFGNRARTERADARVGQAVASLNAEINRVRREVAESLAELQASARQLQLIRQALAPAEEGFQQESERIRQGEGRPIELLDSFRQLFDTRQDILRATVAYDVAQFRLWVAVGSSPLADAGVCPPIETPPAPKP
jgi:outer membrane protein TolC